MYSANKRPNTIIVITRHSHDSRPFRAGNAPTSLRIDPDAAVVSRGALAPRLTTKASGSMFRLVGAFVGTEGRDDCGWRVIILSADDHVLSALGTSSHYSTWIFWKLLMNLVFRFRFLLWPSSLVRNIFSPVIDNQDNKDEDARCRGRLWASSIIIDMEQPMRIRKSIRGVYVV